MSLFNDIKNGIECRNDPDEFRRRQAAEEAARKPPSVWREAWWLVKMGFWVWLVLVLVSKGIGG